jgi:hypothetical protein
LFIPCISCVVFSFFFRRENKIHTSGGRSWTLDGFGRCLFLRFWWSVRVFVGRFCLLGFSKVEEGRVLGRLVLPPVWLLMLYRWWAGQWTVMVLMSVSKGYKGMPAVFLTVGEFQMVQVIAVSGGTGRQERR